MRSIKPKDISVVIFDCDGVMFDSCQANINFYNHLLAHFNLPPMDKSDVPFVHMHTADESVLRIFRKTPYLEEAQAYRMEMEYTPFIKDMIIEPGLKQLLGGLKPKYGLSVATNRSNTIGEVLRSNGLQEFFDIVVSSLDVKNSKPHPEAIFKILNFYKISPDECIYVGDSAVDYETARAAKIPFVAYKNKDLRADFHVDYLLDIAKKILGLDIIFHG